MTLAYVATAIALITALHFSLRLPRLKVLPRGIDAQFHLLCASRFHRGRAPKTVGKFVVGDKYTHPPLLHFLLSGFPERRRPQALFLLGVVADYSLALAVYFVAIQFVPTPYALVASLIYCVTPASFIQSTSESARPLGALWYCLTILLLPSQSILWMACAAVTTTLTLLSHKMATQTLVFTCLILSPFLFTANPLFPLPLVFGFGLALLLTKGGYLNVLADHIAFITFHLRYGSWNRKRKLPGSPKQLVKLNPYFFLPLLGFWISPQMFLSGSILMLAWYASVLVIFFVWFWGDSERYLMYSAVPTSILVAITLNVGANPLFLIPPLFGSGAMILRNSRVFFKRDVLPDYTKIEVTQDAVTLVKPSSLTYVSARNMKGRILCGGGNATALKFELEILPKIMSTNPHVLLKDYHLTYALLGPKNRDYIEPIEDNFEFAIKTNGYTLYKRKQ